MWDIFGLRRTVQIPDLHWQYPMIYFIEMSEAQTTGSDHRVDPFIWKPIDKFFWRHQDLAHESRNLHQDNDPDRCYRVKAVNEDGDFFFYLETISNHSNSGSTTGLDWLK